MEIKELNRLLEEKHGKEFWLQFLTKPEPEPYPKPKFYSPEPDTMDSIEFTGTLGNKEVIWKRHLR